MAMVEAGRDVRRIREAIDAEYLKFGAPTPTPRP
jgi:hypothetical protein